MLTVTWVCVDCSEPLFSGIATPSQQKKKRANRPPLSRFLLCVCVAVLNNVKPFALDGIMKSPEIFVTV